MTRTQSEKHRKFVAEKTRRFGNVACYLRDRHQFAAFRIDGLHDSCNGHVAHGDAPNQTDAVNGGDVRVA